jgi:hypothetical protein
MCGRAEKEDIAVWTTVCFHALIGLLAVVECWGETMDAEIWVCDKCGLAPFAGGDSVCRFNMAVDFVLDGEAELVPVDGFERGGWEDHTGV